MKLIKCLFVLHLSIFILSCPLGVNIDIGDYDYHLEEWNNQNMFNYQIVVKQAYPNIVNEAIILVKNGIPKSINKPYWDVRERLSTIPDYYSFINKEIIDKQKISLYNYSFVVKYNTEYHYPVSIICKRNGSEVYSHFISLMPLEEGELEIDIGDYESQLAAWNNVNLQDYQLKIRYKPSDYTTIFAAYTESIIVRKGIPNESRVLNYPMIKTTIPEFFNFIKAEEESVRNLHEGKYRCFLNVQYDTEYHYPKLINSGGYYLFGRNNILEITVTPLEKE